MYINTYMYIYIYIFDHIYIYITYIMIYRDMSRHDDFRSLFPKYRDTNYHIVFISVYILEIYICDYIYHISGSDEAQKPQIDV